jgi:hypothetical protein
MHIKGQARATDSASGRTKWLTFENGNCSLRVFKIDTSMLKPSAFADYHPELTRVDTIEELTRVDTMEDFQALPVGQYVLAFFEDGLNAAFPTGYYVARKAMQHATNGCGIKFKANFSKLGDKFFKGFE